MSQSIVCAYCDRPLLDKEHALVHGPKCPESPSAKRISHLEAQLAEALADMATREKIATATAGFEPVPASAYTVGDALGLRRAPLPADPTSDARIVALEESLDNVLAEAGPCDTSRPGFHTNATGTHRARSPDECSACAARKLLLEPKP